jgi:hypothetical protein
VAGVGYRLALGRISYFAFTVFDEGNYGRGGAASFTVGDDYRLVAFHHGNAGVGGSQVDSDYFFHD